MSSGQSLRNGNSVEPGLPNTFLMPNARNRVSVASLTLLDLPAVFVGLGDNAVSLEDYLPVIASSDRLARNEGRVTTSRCPSSSAGLPNSRSTAPCRHRYRWH